MFLELYSKFQSVTMKRGRLMRSWFDLKGMKKWDFPNSGFGRKFRHVPSPVHDRGEINDATLHIHGLIKKEISEGNY